MRRFLSFISGAALGGIVGAAIALLLAPASGESLQSQIKERAEYIQLEVRKAAEERRVELEEQLSALRAPRQDTAE